MAYRKTLNIPSTKFPMRANLNDNAEKYRAYWKTESVFEKLTSREKGEVFVLHDGPPYANGDIHMGHALNKILKDFILRYRALRGHRIHYIPGWDTHGLPIENRVEKANALGSLDIRKRRQLCREYALEQADRQWQQFKQLQLLTDFRQTYRTLDECFVNFELKIFASLWEKGLLQYGLKPVAWSWSFQTALAESEIIYKEVETKSIYFWFPTQEEHRGIPKGTRLLIWTTTPYTLEANLAAMVNPDLVYVYGLDKGNNGYLLLEEAMERLGLDLEVKKRFRGEELKGLTYLNPITKEVNRVIEGEHVLGSGGTGVVHAAPGYGLEDYEACQRVGIGVYVSLRPDGHFMEKTKFRPIDGLFYAEASEVVINHLRETGYLHRVETITHSVGHDWRTEKPLVYLASPQWFLNLEMLLPTMERIFREQRPNTLPAWMEERLEQMVTRRSSWCLSRQRFWGTPIPVLFHGENRPILTREQMEYTLYLLREGGIEVWFEEDPEYFLCPALREKYGGKKLTKSKDILDVWFDSGCSWGILESVPADVYLEGFDQLRGWFNSSAILSMAYNGKLPFKQVIGHGFVLDSKGNKMSKSKGNVVSPLELISKHGADVVRLWIGLNNCQEDISLSEESMEQAVTLYRRIRNTLFRYSLSLLGENFFVSGSILEALTIPENILFYQMFRTTWAHMEAWLEGHWFFRPLRLCSDFLNLYSNWFLEISKDDLYCGDPNSPMNREILAIVGDVFEKLLFLLSIYIPQTAEEAWSHHRPLEGSIFLQRWPTAVKNYRTIDRLVWDDFWRLRTEVLALVEELKNKGEVSGPTSVTLIIPSNRCMEGLDLRRMLNLAEVIAGETLGVRKCDLPLCMRCRRHHSRLQGDLCLRCSQVLVNRKGPGDGHVGG